MVKIVLKKNRSSPLKRKFAVIRVFLSMLNIISFRLKNTCMTIFVTTFHFYIPRVSKTMAYGPTTCFVFVLQPMSDEWCLHFLTVEKIQKENNTL